MLLTRVLGVCAAPQVFFASVRSGGSSQVYFMTLNRNCIMNWWRNHFFGQCVGPSRVWRRKCIWNSHKTHTHIHTNVTSFPSFFPARSHSHSHAPKTHTNYPRQTHTHTQTISKSIPAYTPLTYSFYQGPLITFSPESSWKITDELQMLIPSINLYCIYSRLDLLYLVELCSVVII